MPQSRNEAIYDRDRGRYVRVAQVEQVAQAQVWRCLEGYATLGGEDNKVYSGEYMAGCWWVLAGASWGVPEGSPELG